MRSLAPNASVAPTPPARAPRRRGGTRFTPRWPPHTRTTSATTGPDAQAVAGTSALRQPTHSPLARDGQDRVDATTCRRPTNQVR